MLSRERCAGGGQVGWTPGFVSECLGGGGAEIRKRRGAVWREGNEVGLHWSSLRIEETLGTAIPGILSKSWGSGSELGSELGESRERMMRSVVRPKVEMPSFRKQGRGIELIMWRREIVQTGRKPASRTGRGENFLKHMCVCVCVNFSKYCWKAQEGNGGKWVSGLNFGRFQGLSLGSSVAEARRGRSQIESNGKSCKSPLEKFFFFNLSL